MIFVPFSSFLLKIKIFLVFLSFSDFKKDLFKKKKMEVQNMEIIFNDENFTQDEANRMDTYIKKVVRNSMADFIKHKKQKSQFFIFDLDSLAELDSSSTSKIEMKNYHIFEFTISISDEKLSEVLDGLPEYILCALLLGIGLRLPNKELAKRLQISEGMVQYYKTRGKSILKKKLKEGM